MIYGVSKHTLCTVGEKRKNCFVIFSFPSYLQLCLAASPQSVYSGHPGSNQKEKSVSIIRPCVNFFCYVSPDKAILVLVGHSSPEVYMWAFPCVPLSELAVVLSRNVSGEERRPTSQIMHCALAVCPEYSIYIGYLYNNITWNKITKISLKKNT